jgi:hypothetical protein
MGLLPENKLKFEKSIKAFCLGAGKQRPRSLDRKCDDDGATHTPKI